MTALGLSLTILLSQPITTQGDILDKIIPNIDVKDANAIDVLKNLLKDVHMKMWVSPEIELAGKITLKLHNAKFEVVLQHILNQVNFTYMYLDHTFLFLPREGPGWDPAPPVDLPIFQSKGFTSKYSIKNSNLFLTPKKTMGGTFDLLTEATRSANFEWWDEWSYGSCGFAITLAFEAIDQRGAPLPHSRLTNFNLRYLSKFGMARLPELFASGFGNQDKDYRMIVLTASDSSSKSTRPWRYPGIKGLPYDFQIKHWNKSPEVTAFIYEFRRQNGNQLATLLKPGQSKISARQHLILSGLWTDNELGK
jgi:hypothetical protein